MGYRKISLLSFLTILLTVLTFLLSSFVSQKRIITQKKAQVSLSPQETPATMADYWQGKAVWKLRNTLTQYSPNIDYFSFFGTDLEQVDGVWYLFSRNGENGTSVRRSSDKGYSWSAPVKIITPTPAAPWGSSATDGDAVYDPVQNRWHYLFQCAGNYNFPGWNVCHIYRDGKDPMGPFTYNAGENPVIKPGDIWRTICTDASKDCYVIPNGKPVTDEGTIDIFDKKDGYYYVSFHGYVDMGKIAGTNYTLGYGFRGIAKTADFKTFITGKNDSELPNDSILDKKDALNWRENWSPLTGPIGFGAGSILKENGFYYIVSEAADYNLGIGIPNQNYDWGIYRSSLLNSTAWEPFPLGNPIYYNCKLFDNPLPVFYYCSAAYMRLFRDFGNGQIYMMVGREIRKGTGPYVHSEVDPTKAGIYVYELVKSGNLLRNADLWKCNSDNWSRTGTTTNLAVYRYFYDSSDGNCFLATNCGGSSCTGDYSIFQDVNITPGSLPNVEFGGKFATDIQSGNADLYLWELSSDFTPLANHKITAALNTSYQEIKGTTTLRSDTSKLRFQLYLHTPSVTFKADEMFVQPYVPGPTPTFAPIPSTVTPKPPTTPTKTPVPTSAPPPPSALSISNIRAVSGKTYTQETLNTGVKYYTDRSYAISSLPSGFSNLKLIRTANDDKGRKESVLLTFNINRPATVYVAYDRRATKIPSWLSGFTPLTGIIRVNDGSLSYFKLYQKSFPAGTVALGGNMASPASGANSNYIVIVSGGISSPVLTPFPSPGTPTLVPSAPPPPSALSISNIRAVSGKTYTQETLNTGVKYYTDRSYAISSLPSGFSNLKLIRTANDDKGRKESVLLTFNINRPATVYVAYDRRATKIPSWLSGFTPLTGIIRVNDGSLSYFKLYQKSFPAGTVALGGNMASPASGANSNYIVIVR